MSDSNRIVRAGDIAGASAQSTDGELAPPPIVPVPRDEALPLSSAQKHLWMLDQANPGCSGAGTGFALELCGPLDSAALARTLGELIARHEVLRTTFSIRDGDRVQVVGPAREDYELPVEDLRSVPREKRLSSAAERLSEERAAPFDLLGGPLMRCRLLRLDDERHRLIVTMHNIITDDGSMGVIFRELGALYAAFRAGEASPLPPLEVHYADFTAWQNRRFEGGALMPSLDYWRERLADVPTLELVTDHVRPPVQTFCAAEKRMDLDADIARAVDELSRSEQATLFMTASAAFALLLQRYTGQDDLIVASAIPNRDHPQIANMIGCFADSLVLRMDLSGDPTFRELLRRVRSWVREAYQHRDTPFEYLVEKLETGEDPSRHPLCQVAFVQQDASTEHPDFPGLEVRPAPLDAVTSRFDLEVRVGEHLAGLGVGFIYKTDLFEAATISRMVRHFQNLLREIAADPDRPLSRLSMLDVDERQRLLELSNRSPTVFAAGSCLHQLFEARAAAASDAVAVTCGDERLTYRQLNSRANQLAHALRDRGVGPDVLVGLCTDRNLHLVIGILGILKAGGGYVPVDLANPGERIAFILEDTGVELLVTESSQLEKLPDHRAACLCLDRDGPELDRQSTADPVSATNPAHTAYVIYTSGSTGQPKGVVVEHGMVVRLFAATRDWFCFDERDVWTLFHSSAFDFSVWELWGALLHGGRLVVVPYLVSRSPGDFYELLQRERVTVLNQTPSAFRQLIAVDAARDGADRNLALQWVIFGGEALDLQMLRPWFERHGDDRPRLVNMYGITETTVHVTYRPLRTADLEAASGSVIGVPIPDLQVYVLDPHMQLVPVGVRGELYVGGAGVARGYLDRPELTAERFVEDPFRRETGARLYRTGDLARWRLPDGDLEYLGRNDDQVKIRGFRIELGEIEAALLRSPAVREAVIVARARAPGEKQLVAYFVAAQGEKCGRRELRRLLQQRLPSYMVPSALVRMEALPLTPNGKVDRKELPPPDWERESEYVAPRDALEHELADLWRRTLEVDQVGVLDSFIDLGGDSLQGASIVSDLEARLGETVYVSAIFEAPTLAELADYLRDNYDRAAAKICGEGDPAEGEAVLPPLPQRESRIDESDIARLRCLIDPLEPRPASLAIPATKNPPALFVLSPPRSGSTLLRVMLGGHPGVFAPPELDLLSFNSLGERKAKCVGRYAFILEGAIRTIQELKGGEPDRARRVMAAFEAQDLPVREFYQRLQEWIGDRTLVEKSTIYSHDPETLKRIEADFREPLYIHLVRHPCGMIRSFEEARIDRIFRFENPYSPRQLAELLWTIHHENMLAFLEGIPGQRWHRVDFEALVADPESVMDRVCRFLGIDQHEDMLDPYRNRERRMTDGLYEQSRVIGDYKFAQHKKVEATVADRWREVIRPDVLGDPTRRLARRLGYEDVPIAGAVAATTYPLMPVQQRLWLLDQTGAGAAYNVVHSLRLSGSLDLWAFEAAIQGIVQRHEVLRTTFPIVDGVPRQFVAPALRVPLRDVDLRSEAADRARAAARVVEEMASEPFDLARGPLLRAAMIRLADDDQIFVFVVHHIVFDDRSVSVFFHELEAHYQAFTAGQPHGLADLPVQFGQLAESRHRELTGELLDRQLAYWRRQLADLAVLDLPTDHPRPQRQSFEGGAVELSVGADVLAGLVKLGRSRSVTQGMVMQALWAALLARYTGQEDIVFGLATATRVRAEARDVIGFFANTVVLRIDLSGDPTFEELLERTKQTAVAALDNRDVTFERLVQELQPERDPSRNPLFQVFLGLYESPWDALHLPGVQAQLFERGVVTSHFDLELQIGETPRGLEGRLLYCTRLFDRSSIEGLRDHYLNLLKAVAADPDRRVSELPLIGKAERRGLLGRFSRTGDDYPRDRCIHELFEQQVQRRPDAIAVSHEGESLTYAQLDERANQLAHRLRQRGVGAEVLVGFCAERGLEMLVGLLGILKAGGAYVPLDPSFPVERLRFMLQDSGTKLLVTQRHLAPAASDFGGEIVCFDEPDLAGTATGRVASVTRPDNLAYVIYTSGSTGKPKGVEIPHGAVVNFLTSMADRPGLDAGDALLAVTTLSFDIAVLELLLPLSVGARVEVVSRDVASDGYRLQQKLIDSGATVMQATPATWQMLVQTGWQGDNDLKILCGGEELPRPLAEQLLARSRELWNMYGPTEATIWSAVARVEPGEGPVTIGEPIANTQLLVLDPHLDPVPRGVPGELHIGGEGLARGYHDRRDLTAQRFVASPWSEGVPQRLYKTGDLVRCGSDGRLRFLGRLDQQVKLRGFRIELGEIEAVLARHPAVREAVATVREDRPGDRRLVAYILPADGASPVVSEVEAFLAEHLPSYMVPSATITLDALPLTANGKIDRKALPAPDPRDRSTRYVAPRSGSEEVLCAIWCDVLGVERVGVHDDFFDLGGHSLLGTQLVSRVRSAFGIEVPLIDLFDHSTVAELAEYLHSGGTRAAKPPLERIERKGDLPVSFAQQRLCVLDEMGAGANYNMQIAVRLTGCLDVASLERTLQEIVRRHETLRTAFPKVDGQPVQRISPSLVVQLQRHDLGGHEPTAREAAVRELARAEFERPFDLASGSLLRGVLVRLSDDDHALLLTMHHIVSDGWSKGVLNRELTTLYGAFSRGEPSPLPELEIQYGDFAVWQRRWLQGEVSETQLSYWRAQLDGVSNLDLPTDRPRPAVQTFRGAAFPLAVPVQLTEELRRLSRRTGSTLAMVLLAAWQAMLSRYTGQADIAIGLPIANRTHRELESLIGFFVNLLVMRTDLSGDPSFEEVVRRVRANSFSAYEHQDIPFERVVEELNPSRDQSRHPFFQVMFAVQNAPEEVLRLGDLEGTPLPLGPLVTRFDLEIHVHELGAGLRGIAVYNVDLFDVSTIECMIRHYVRLLEGVVANPKARLSELPLLSDEERHQLVVEWSGTASVYPHDRCIHELFGERDRCVHGLFEEQARKTPDAVAVTYDDERLTYRELNEWANQLAHCLRKHGVGPEAPVAICVERGIELVVGLLGILKAGGAYVPLDPGYPAQRLAFMLEDTQARVVLTQQRLLPDLTELRGQVICLDADSSDLAAEPIDNLANLTIPDHLAYVIYTSGSTGDPKGVCVPHRAILRLVLETDYVDLGPSDRIAQASITSFDAATFEIWGALLHGARLVGLSKEVALHPSLMADEIRNKGISVLFVTTALFNQLIGQDQEIFAPLRYLLFGGEAVDPQSVRMALEGGRPEHLLHVYGPTENTTFSTWHEVEEVPEGARTVPIGRPIANTQAYVLDRVGQPVPVGIPGELYLGGDGLAHGYLNAPELTADRFTPHPFQDDPSARLYRTGDLVRYKPSGAIEFIGRIDNQVKIRGHRIEPGEIEMALLQSPAVREAVVIVREDIPGDKRLVAYAATDGDDRSSPEELRRSLADRLPAYMIPSAIVTMASLPLTPNGKIDRAALPAPAGRLASDATVAPRNPTEAVITAIWADLLGVARVGVHDNFFELGGHSLLAMQVISRLRDEFEVEIPLESIFESGTVAGLGERVDVLRWASSDPGTAAGVGDSEAFEL